LEKEKDQFANERDRFLEGLGTRFTNQINNILEDINSTAEAAHTAKLPDLPPHKKSPNRKSVHTAGGGKPLPSSGTYGQTLSIQIESPGISPRVSSRMNDAYLDDKISDDIGRLNPLELTKRSREAVKRSVSSPKESLIKVSTKTPGPGTSLPGQKNQKITTSIPNNSCTLCKGAFTTNQIIFLRGKPFCSRCKERLLEGAKQRGMNI